jgi:hypothetical protein
MFNSMMQACAEERLRLPRLGTPTKATAKAATPASVEILIKMLLIGAIKCFIMNAPKLLPITLETLSPGLILPKRWRSY